MVDVAGDLDGHEAAQGRNDPAHGEDDESGDDGARSACARKRSRSTISSVRTPAQTTRVMTSAACSRWRASEAA